MLTQPARTTITTAIPGLRLTEFVPADAPTYYSLVDRNRTHLSQHGDYTELTHATLASVTKHLTEPAGEQRRFGIWLNDTLIGRADVSPRLPGHIVIGYWLGSEYTGNGYATIACKALIAYARDHLDATDIFAGVTKGNGASEALLGRLGFEVREDKGTYTLFRLRL